MRSIRKNLIGVVHVYVGGQSVFLGAGDAVPEGVAIREDVLATSEDAAETESLEVEPVEETTEAVPELGEEIHDGMPAESASREEWNIYAESAGVNPAEFSKKEFLIEALKQR